MPAPKFYAKRIAVDVQAHCPDLQQLCSKLRERIGDISPQPTKICLFSTVDGYDFDKPLYGEELKLSYWCDNLYKPVRFFDTISHIARERM